MTPFKTLEYEVAVFDEAGYIDSLEHVDTMELGPRNGAIVHLQAVKPVSRTLTFRVTNALGRERIGTIPASAEGMPLRIGDLLKLHCYPSDDTQPMEIPVTVQFKTQQNAEPAP